MATSQINPPPGFVLEEIKPPQGFVLERTFTPPGFELESKVPSPFALPQIEGVEVQEQFIGPAPKPKKDISYYTGRNFKKAIKSGWLIPGKDAMKSRADLVIAISKYTGLPKNVVDENYDELIRSKEITGVSPDPTTVESIGMAMTGAVTAGLAMNTAATVIGVAGFMALDEAENAIISAITEYDYIPFAGIRGMFDPSIPPSRNISDLLPVEATRATKETLEILDLIGKGLILGAVHKKGPAIVERITKEYVDSYSLPKTLYLDAKKVRAAQGVKAAGKITKVEAELLKELNLSSSQWRAAAKNGITIEVPTEKITRMVDKPWYGKIKKAFTGKVTDKVVKSERLAQEPIKVAPRALLEEPAEVAYAGKKVVFEPPIEVPAPEVKVGDIIEPSKEIRDWAKKQKTFINVNEKSIRKEWLDYDPEIPNKRLESVVKDELRENRDKVSQLDNNPVKVLQERIAQWDDWIRNASKEEIDEGNVETWKNNLKDDLELINTLEEIKPEVEVEIKPEVEVEIKPEVVEAVDYQVGDKVRINNAVTVTVKEITDKYIVGERGGISEQYSLTNDIQKVEPVAKKPPRILKEQEAEKIKLTESIAEQEQQLDNPDLTTIQRKKLEQSISVSRKLVEGIEGFERREEIAEEKGVPKDLFINASTPGYEETKIPTEPVADVKPISKREIVSEMRKRFGIAIKGKVTEKWKRGLMGYYKGFENIIRTRTAEDIITLSHELAHFIDRDIFGLVKTKNRPHFKKWADELGPLDYDQSKQRTSEGFAEFVRYYLTGETAQERAPKFYKYFTGEFAEKNPEVIAHLNDLKVLFERYDKQGSLERVKQQIDYTGKPPPQTIAESAQDIARRFRIAWLDNLAGLKDVMYKQADLEGKLRPSDDPIFLLELFAGGKYRSKAQYYIKENLQPIIKKVADDLDNFLAYAYARRALSRPDINSGIELQDAQFVFEKLNSKKFKETSDQLDAFSEGLLDMMVEVGGLSPESKEQIRLINPFYIPLRRFFVENLKYYKGGVPKPAYAGKPIKGIKGSGRPIINPIESLVIYTENVFQAVDKTKIAKALANLSSLEGMGGFVNKVPPPTDVKKIKLETLEKELERLGLGTYQIFEDAPLEADFLVTLFSQGKKYTGKDNIITLWIDGKPEFYEIHPEVYKAIENIDYYSLGPVLDFMFAGPTRLLKLGAVGIKAGFSLITNPIRDMFAALIYTKARPDPLITVKGVGGYLGVGPQKYIDAARAMKAAGMDMGTMSGADLYRRRKSTQELINSAKGGKGKVLNVVNHPLNAIREIFSIGEMAPRTAEFAKMLEKNEEIYGSGSEDAMLAALHDAQELTINFTRMGYWARALNQMVAFFNPAIRGPQRMIKFARKNPGKFWARGLAFITTPTITAWYYNKDKEWYKNLPGYRKYMNLIIDFSDFSDSEQILMLPLPHEVGLIFTAPVAALDYYYEKDPKAVDEWAKQFVDQSTPPLTPATFKPLIDAYAKKTWYGTDLESLGMQFKEAPDRYRDYTPELAKVLSKWIYKYFPDYEVSPLQVETILSGYTGGILPGVTEPFDYLESGELSDLPAIGRLFLRESSYINRINVDYDRLKRLRQKRGSGTINPNEKRELKITERKLRLLQKRK